MITMAEIKNFPQVFKRLGFRRHAFAVYKAIRKNSPLSATEVIQATGLHRPAVYRALEDLLGAKLISTKKIGKRTYYVPESARRISELFTKDLENVSALIKKREAADVETVDSSMRIFRGPKGIRAVFDDVIDHTGRGDTFYRYTSEKDLAAVNRYLSPDYRKRRDRKKLERLVISNPESGKQKRPRLERFIKFIPPEASLFDQNIIQIIYGSRLALIDLNKEQALVIENAPLADFQKVIFKQLYRKL